MFWSLDELNNMEPDGGHYESTIEIFGAAAASMNTFGHGDASRTVERIEQDQLHDDPADLNGLAKIEAMHVAVRRGDVVPHMVVLHAA